MRGVRIPTGRLSGGDERSELGNCRAYAIALASQSSLHTEYSAYCQRMSGVPYFYGASGQRVGDAEDHIVLS